MQIDKLPRPDRRGRFIAAHRRFIGQSLSDSFVNIHYRARGQIMLFNIFIR
jgi:hypothetical protein